jgi:FAD/FMN-containing dehydrogenase
MAAHVGAGLESWEVHNLMDRYNITLIAPLTVTVGAYGGFMAGGGYSTFASYHGLASDQVLSLTVVTADGKLVTVDPNTNIDLFYAMRGGGGSRSSSNPQRRTR